MKHTHLLSEPSDSKLGRQDYWNAVYKEEASFSWYAGWDDIQPFCADFFEKDSRVLLPGVGNDATVADMFNGGYIHLTAMDYAPEGIERCREMLGESRVKTESQSTGVELLVADARDLTNIFEDHLFDAILEKGTLDAIFLSGGKDKKEAQKNLSMAISELGRCVKPGGIFFSITAVAVDQVQTTFNGMEEWDCLVDKDSLYVTEDGYASNNIDANLLVFRKSTEAQRCKDF
eukprot:scaffold925_cov129-Cylindrotheca_fusiformis.AAC.30